MGGKGGRCVGLTILPPPCADCLEIWDPQPPGTLRACDGIALPLPLPFFVPAQFRTRNLPNTNKEHHHYANLFSVSIILRKEIILVQFACIRAHFTTSLSFALNIADAWSRAWFFVALTLTFSIRTIEICWPLLMPMVLATGFHCKTRVEICNPTAIHRHSSTVGVFANVIFT